MAYWKAMSLPCEFSEENKIPDISETFVTELIRTMILVKPVPAIHKTRRSIQVHKRHTNVSLCLHSEWSHKKRTGSAIPRTIFAKQRSTKFFTLLINENHVNVTADRLKPANILAEEYPAPTNPVRDPEPANSDYLSGNVMSYRRLMKNRRLSGAEK